MVFHFIHYDQRIPPTTVQVLNIRHYHVIVKVHGVFPSSHEYSASSQKFQVHRSDIGDSGEVVTPFMQVGTYPTKNFATLGQS